MSKWGNRRSAGRAAAPRFPSDPLFGRGTLLGGALIALTVLVAYHNTFTVPFLFDDRVTENPTIHHLWPIWQALSPPQDGGPTTGRPLVNLSLAFNYALGRTAVSGYHVFNLIVHLLAGLALLGLVRRTLLLPGMRERFGGTVAPLAVATALLWVAHPLQTEAVTYVAQRAESLMGLFYLLTLYCFVRAVQPGASTLWSVSAFGACLLGMASKEVMASAPLIALLYDRVFVAGSFRQAWRQHWRLHVALAATWLLLVALMLGAHNRGGTAGFGTGVPWWTYALTQCRAIPHYLRLVFWPHPLIFDYGQGALVTSAAAAVTFALIVALLVAGTGFSLWRWPAVGFLGCWFFLILAPSSSVVPVATQSMAEHRMYLPLAAVVMLTVIGVHRGLGKRSPALFLALVVALTLLTVRRNRDYHSALTLWSDTAARCPGNARAQNNLGLALMETGRVDEAIARYQQALKLRPDFELAHNNLGNALLKQGQRDEAIVHFQRAVELQPNFATAHYNLANALLQKGQVDAAAEHFRKALEIQPAHAQAHYNLANLLLQNGRAEEAVVHYRLALALRPDLASAANNLGSALLVLGRAEEAIVSLQQAVDLQPDSAGAHGNLAAALLRMGRVREALAHYQLSVRLQPTADTCNRLAWLLATSPDAVVRDGPQAVRLAEQANRLSGGNHPESLATLAAAHAETGRFGEALATARQALQLATAQTNLALVETLRAQINRYESGAPFREDAH